MRRILVGAGVLVVLGLGTAIATAAIPDEDGYTYICVNKSSGAILAREKGADCRKNAPASRLMANQTAFRGALVRSGRQRASHPPSTAMKAPET